jgi:RNA polymerase sigma-70 factor, ECF subfamily
VRQDTPEDRLLARVAHRDHQALADLYARFERPLFSYLFHLLGQKEAAEDVLQEVMVIVWQQAHTFRGASPATQWIFGIAHHQAYKLFRRETRATLVDLEAALECIDDAPDPETMLVRRAAHDEVIAALANLTPEHREVLELAFFQDFTSKQIAAIVGIPEGTVKSRLSYARRALRAALVRTGNEV